MKFIDLHQDLLFHLRGGGGVRAESQTSIEMLKQQVVVLLASVWVHPKQGNAAVQIIERELNDYHELAHQHGIRIIRTVEDLDWCMAGQRLGFILHLEGLNCWVDQQFELLQRFYDLGLRSFAPVWNEANYLGGGCASTERFGLSLLGSQALDWCHEHKMIIDLAHANQRTFWSALEQFQSPLLVSHANAHSAQRHQRNLSDFALHELALRGGLVGATFINNFIVNGRRAEVADLADHLDRMREQAGAEHIAIGSDFGGILGEPVIGLASVADMPNLWNELSDRAWTDQQIKQLAQENAFRVIRQILLE